MDTMPNDHRNEARVEKTWEDRAPAVTTRWLVILGMVLFVAAIFGAGYAYQQSMATADLAAQNQSLHATIEHIKNQIGAMTAKVNQMSTPAPAQTPVAGSPAGSGAAKRTTSAGSATQDRRMKQVQSQLADQQKQLKDTQDQLAVAKSDLEGKLGSTRDELNGSIARTHEELVGLEQRGQRRYYEFDLSKSKEFQREGPIQISLRKADSKHQSYDLMMLVDDHQLSKKKVDLYEPIWLHESDQPQPGQIVVNKIEKDHVQGYVSAARYKDQQLSNAAQSSADVMSRTISTPTSTSSSTTPATTPATSSEGQE